jgi:hypothetical protein
MISQALAVIMTALGLKRSRKYGEALQTFDQAVEGLLGLNPRLVNQLDDNSLLSMLTVLERFDTDRAIILADIYREQSELYSLLNQIDDSQFTAKRSLRLYLEVFLAGKGDPDPELIKKIETIRIRIEASSLPVETRLALQDYLERMLTSTDDNLAALGLSRARLQADFAMIDDTGLR